MQRKGNGYQMVAELKGQDVFLEWSPEIERRVTKALHRKVGRRPNGPRIEQQCARAFSIERRLVESLHDLTAASESDFEAAWDRAVAAMVSEREIRNETDEASS